MKESERLLLPKLTWVEDPLLEVDAGHQRADGSSHRDCAVGQGVGGRLGIGNDHAVVRVVLESDHDRVAGDDVGSDCQGGALAPANT